MKKKNSIIIFELNKQTKPKDVYKALRLWRKFSKKKFQYETVIKNRDIISILVKPPRPNPPSPPMMPPRFIDSIGSHECINVNKHVQLIKLK
jgi:hypothetical protein